MFQGAVVVDVGANIGIYSEFLSRCVGRTGLVHSFGPSPDNFRRLSAATRDLSNVRLTQAVVGERSGECTLYISDKLNVDHRAYKADGDSRRAVPTEMVALDDYFKDGQRVDLIGALAADVGAWRREFLVASRTLTSQVRLGIAYSQGCYGSGSILDEHDRYNSGRFGRVQGQVANAADSVTCDFLTVERL